jgi:serine/threonine protein phosphatase 1
LCVYRDARSIQTAGLPAGRPTCAAKQPHCQRLAQYFEEGPEKDMFTISAKTVSGPPGVRIYAIGDIHGRLDLLDMMLDTIAAHEAAWPGGRAVLVFLGDYVDRGKHSRGVLERLMGGLPEAIEAHFLRGNHEDIMLRCLDEPRLFSNWAVNGGLTTLASYGVDPGLALDGARAMDALARALPDSHLAFLKGLRLSLELGDFFFVHGGVRPDVPLCDQDEQDLLYIREPFLSHRGDFGRVVVHGHTPVREPEMLPNRIGIDTGAFFTGRLTALLIEGEQRRFISVQGEGRG